MITDRPHAPSLLDAVLFDFGNVLIHWEPERAFEGHLTGPEVSQFFADIDFPSFNLQQDAGRSWSDAKAELAQHHPHHADNVDMYVRNFRQTLTGPVPGSLALVRAVKAAGLRAVGLTNWSAETVHHAADVAVAIDVLDDYVVSGREGVAKPDPRIFDIAIDKLKLVPERTLFLDDSALNIDAARQHGFNVFLFTDAAGAAAEFARWGIETEVRG